jgi:NAD(P)-dependent dehydrogenase (short-subunit alcohol dehydrogenase family)
LAATLTSVSTPSYRSPGHQAKLKTLAFIICQINFNYDETHAGCGKFAMRGLSQSLAKEFQPAGVHIAHVIIDGVLGERRLVSEMTIQLEGDFYRSDYKT